MEPRLAAISGKLKGATFSVGEEAIVIGRDTQASLCIADPSVSRRHSQIEKQGEEFVINDLDSLNGTFINDVPVKTRSLQHGDRLRIGESQFLFLLNDGDKVNTSSQVQFDDRNVQSGSTIQLRFNDALYLMARDLSALMKVSTTINAIHGLEKLQKTLLELLFEVVPAQHGAILLSDEGSTEFESLFGLDRRLGADETIKVSRTIAKQVMRDGAALLASNPATDPELATESMISSQPGSVLCVPLMMFDRPLGVIYLDTKEPAIQIDRDHLQLVTAIAGIAAVAIQNARHIEWLEGENRRLLEDVNIEHNMIGESPVMRQVYQLISKVAPTDSTVLISGESGTGKELAARAIHQNSKRNTKPFVAVNCAALAESLLESELFGHEKGAFTGAVAQKKGRLEIAEGGTVFLDEIGELSPGLQAKLLRVLQDREFDRVGGTKCVRVDFRLVAATNRNLEEAIAGGLFRRDLYYRLNVVSLALPPLRERLEDIPLLASWFIRRHADKAKRPVSGMSAEALACLTAYDWPGNVRELENAVESAVVLGLDPLVLRDDLPDAVAEAGASATAAAGPATVRFHDAVTERKKDLI